MNDHKPSPVLLQHDRVIETIAVLRRRIEERFPGSGLSALCGELLLIAQQSSQRARSINQPNWPIRIVTLLLASAMVLGLAITIGYAIRSMDADDVRPLDWIAIVEAGLNDIIFFVLAIFFLVSLDRRIKRRRAIQAIHELRAVAHVVDMHQLTKNPERSARDWERTEHSPTRTMTPFQLNRYLDYCSEMLSLVGKLAALYVQKFDDPAALAAVSEVEQLTTSLSRKIWQKIMILEAWQPKDKT
ncbi:MAG: hypothetical protein AAF664_17815 [Planctomycetota bacterium]